MKITSLDLSIKDLLKSSSCYIIPRFQRPYSWEQQQIEEFWEDVIDNESQDYFIGSFVFYNIKSNKGVVDGQQRLTTITILLCALRDILNTQKLPKKATGIHQFIQTKDEDANSVFVLKTESSYPFLQDYIQHFGKPESKPQIGKEEVLLNNTYNYFTEKINDRITEINKKKTKSKKRLIEKMLVQIRDLVLSLRLISIELDNEDEAYLIFETLNTRGKDLKISDLVKNHITKHTKKINKDMDLIKDQWNEIRDIFKESAKDLDVSTFIFHYWLSKYQYVSSKKLFKAIKKEITKPKVKQFSQDLLENAKYYRAIFEVDYLNWSKDEYAVKNSLKAISLFNVKQPVPFLLTLIREYKNNNITKKQLCKTLEFLERFHFSYNAVASKRSNWAQTFPNYAKKLHLSSTKNKKSQCINELKKKLKEKKPTYEEFKSSFIEFHYSQHLKKDRKIVRYILEKIHRYNYKGEIHPVDYEKMTIEHIYPENSKSKRKDKMNSKTIANLGNLILLSEDFNIKLKNKAFKSKKIKLKNAGINLEKEFINKNRWKKEEISKRINDLSKLAYDEVWKI